MRLHEIGSEVAKATTLCGHLSILLETRPSGESFNKLLAVHTALLGRGIYAG